MDNHSFDALPFGNRNTSYPLLAEGYNQLYFDYSHFGYTQINWFVYHKLYHNISFLAYCLPNSFNEQSLVSCKACLRQRLQNVCKSLHSFVKWPSL
jgi:hypothetical protein